MPTHRLLPRTANFGSAIGGEEARRCSGDEGILAMVDSFSEDVAAERAGDDDGSPPL